jgi:hypothetical protein
MNGMNPSEETGSQFPGPESIPGAPAGSENMPPAMPPAVPGMPPAAGQAAPAGGVPSMTLPLPVAPASNPQQNDVPATTQSATPTVVDDGDLIEKEWVNKAKQIVDQNRNDPFKQSEELTVFRADYMKKRYNKNIKLDK